MRRGEMIQIRVFPHELNTIKRNANVYGFDHISEYVRAVAINGGNGNNAPTDYVT